MPYILDNNEKIDAFATIFYMINSLQEFEPDDADLDDRIGLMQRWLRKSLRWMT